MNKLSAKEELLAKLLFLFLYNKKRLSLSESRNLIFSKNIFI